jgi:hypothetical protein
MRPLDSLELLLKHWVFPFCFILLCCSIFRLFVKHGLKGELKYIRIENSTHFPHFLPPLTQTVTNIPTETSKTVTDTLAMSPACDIDCDKYSTKPKSTMKL